MKTHRSLSLPYRLSTVARRLEARRRRPDRRQGGFTLVEIMVVIGILAILSAIVMSTASTDSSKATALFSSMQTTSDSLERMKMDTGCYPTSMQVLWTKANATSSNMYCGQDSTTTWDGPYLKPMPFSSTNLAIQMMSVAPSAMYTFSRETGGNNGYYYFLHATNLPTGIVQLALQKCNGSNATSATFSTGKCRGTTSTSSTASGTLDLLVEDAAS